MIRTLSNTDFNINVYQLKEQVSLLDQIKLKFLMNFQKNYQLDFRQQIREKRANFQSFWNKCVQITFQNTDIQNIRNDLQLPFVKLHIVYQQTGQYYQLTSQEYLECFCSCNFNMDLNELNEINWGKEIFIQDTNKIIIDKDTLMLFEILDINLQSENQDFVKEVAWGYLLPVSKGGFNQGQLSIQLYEYNLQFDQDLTFLLQRAKQTPKVFYEYILNLHKEINVKLNIFLEFKEFDKDLEMQIKQQQKKEAQQNQDFINKILANKLQQNIPRQKSIQTNQKQESFLDNKIINQDQGFIIPKQIKTIQQHVGNGVSCIQFSNNGRYLCYSIQENIVFSYLIIYDLQLQQIINKLEYFVDEVISFEWLFNDQFIIAISKQKQLKIFKTELVYQGVIQSVQAIQEIDLQFEVKSLKIYQQLISEKLINFFTDNQQDIFQQYLFNIQDYQVKVVKGNMNQKQLTEIVEIETINCLEISQEYLFVGSSQGNVIVFQIVQQNEKLLINYFKILQMKNPQEIFSINFNENLNVIFIQSSGNQIEMYSLKYFKKSLTFKNNGNSKEVSHIQATVDGKYLFSSVNNQLTIWDIMTGGLIDFGTKITIKTNKLKFSINSKYNLIAISGDQKGDSVFLLYQQH